MDFLKSKTFLIVGIGLVILAPIFVSLIVTKIPFQFPFNQPKEVRLPLPTSAPVSPQVQKGPYLCPSVVNFCKNGQDIEQNGSYLGFGASLEKSLPVFASFDGNTIITTNTLGEQFKNEEIVSINLVNIERGLEAVYFFNGQAQPAGVVKKGDQIGTISDKMNFYKASLVFQLFKGNSITGEKVKLTSGDFE